MKISFSKKRLWVFFLIFGIVFYAFTIDTYILNSIYNNTVIMVLFIVAAGYFALKSRFREIYKVQGLWLLFSLYILLNMLVFNGLRATITKMHFAWVILCLLITFLSKINSWQKYAYYSIFGITIFHTISAWFYFFNPSKYAEDILSIAEEPYRSGLITVMNNGAILGFANFYSATGMYVSIGCIASFAYALSKKEKKWYAITLFMLMSLFMTAKRGVTLFAIISIILIYLIAAGDRIKSVFRSYTRLFLAILGAVILLIVLGNSVLPGIMGMFERTKILLSLGNASANRFMLWAGAFNVFFSNPLFGCGWSNFNSVSGLAETCSTYLELLSCTGIVGFLLFLMAAVNTLAITIKKFKIITQQKVQICFDEKLIITFALSMQLLFLFYSITAQAIVLPSMYISYFLSCAMGLAYKIK